MNKNAIVTLLVCIFALAGCAAFPPDTEAERERQDRAEQQRRVDAMNRGP